MQLHIENMTCGGCVRGVTKAIQNVDPQAAIKADLERKDVEVETTAPRERLVEALATAGFDAA